MIDIYRGSLVRLSALDPKENSKVISRFTRDSELMRLFGSGPTRVHSPKATTEIMEKEMDLSSGRQYWFSICLLEGKRLLGETTLWLENPAARDAFVGIGIYAREDWGKGYGTEAMRLMLRYAFIELNLRRVTLTVFEYNPRAIHSYEKAGFHHEGRLRGALLKDGKRWDMLYMGILFDDWKEMHHE